MRSQPPGQVLLPPGPALGIGLGGPDKCFIDHRAASIADRADGFEIPAIPAIIPGDEFAQGLKSLVEFDVTQGMQDLTAHRGRGIVRQEPDEGKNGFPAAQAQSTEGDDALLGIL